MFSPRSGAKRRVPLSCETVRPVSVMPLAARVRKSTVWPPLAPLTAIVTCSAPSGGVAASHLPRTPSHQNEVAASVPSRRPVVGADGEVDLAAGLPQLFGDLHP